MALKSRFISNIMGRKLIIISTKEYYSDMTLMFFKGNTDRE